jgi:hypothetical protein
MKKILFALMITAMLLSPAVLAKNEKQTEPLDKITFIHYKDGTAKIVGGAAKSPICYKLMGIKWNSLPQKYVIDPDGYNQTFVASAISSATKTWDDATTKSLFSTYAIGSAPWDSSSPDYKNAYVFGSYPDSDVIAVTNVWYTRFGKQIVDYDVLFNTYYNWYDCTTTTCNAANRGMDLRNIAIHETGHGIGLSDIYSSSCSAVTMYGYSWYGDVGKRTLEQPDITGLQKIYG